jgi:hypothetical protein
MFSRNRKGPHIVAGIDIVAHARCEMAPTSHFAFEMGPHRHRDR